MPKRKTATETKPDPSPTGTAPDAADATPAAKDCTPATEPLAEIQPASEPDSATPAPSGETLEEKLAAALKHAREIEAMNSQVIDANTRVASAQSSVEEAKGELKSEIERRDSLVRELTRFISDDASGQQRLPFDAPAKMATEEPINITEFAANRLEALLGADLMAESKGRDEPLGLTDKQLDKFAEAGIATVQELEKRMTDKPHDWWAFLAGKADAASVGRVLNSWREFRMKRPAGESPKPPTIVDSLAEKNEAANERTLLDRDPATSERIEPITIAEAGSLYVGIRTIRTDDNKWLTEFESVTPSGMDTQDHDVTITARFSEPEAVQARLGFLISRWDGMTFDLVDWGRDHAAIMSGMRDWLNALSAGKSIDDVEAEMVAKAAKAGTVPF